MLLTRLMCSSPKSPRSTTSSLAPSTACSVSLPLFTLPAHASCPNSVFFCPRAGILSLMGNCILLLVAYHKRSTLKPAEFFIVNLSISDLGMTLTLFPLAIPSSFSHRCGRTDAGLGRIGCTAFKLLHRISSLFVQMSIKTGKNRGNT